MKGWIKFFGLSFFSDKIATEAVKRGFSSIALALLLSFIFFLFGYYGADVAPFAARYDGAESYKQFISNGFSKSDIEIKDGKASSAKKINPPLANAYKIYAGCSKWRNRVKLRRISECERKGKGAIQNSDALYRYSA